MGCSPWGRKESDTTERLHFHFSLSCIGEGNGNPLQCSCLENPRDGGAWGAAVYGVAQSRIRLKHLKAVAAAVNLCLDLCFDLLCIGQNQSGLVTYFFIVSCCLFLYSKHYYVLHAFFLMV